MNGEPLPPLVGTPTGTAKTFAGRVEERGEVQSRRMARARNVYIEVHGVAKRLEQKRNVNCTRA